MGRARGPRRTRPASGPRGRPNASVLAFFPGSRSRTLLGRAERDFCADGRAATGLRVELEPAVEVANALAHVDQAHASGIAGGAGNEADAIVGDDQTNDCVGAHELDA